MSTRKKHDSTIHAVHKELGSIRLVSVTLEDLISTLQEIKERFPGYESLFLHLPKGESGVDLRLTGLRNETQSERHTRKLDKPTS